jgi:hypothetical protein
MDNIEVLDSSTMTELNKTDLHIIFHDVIKRIGILDEKDRQLETAKLLDCLSKFGELLPPLPLMEKEYPKSIIEVREKVAALLKIDEENPNLHPAVTVYKIDQLFVAIAPKINVNDSRDPVTGEWVTMYFPIIPDYRERAFEGRGLTKGEGKKMALMRYLSDLKIRLWDHDHCCFKDVI